MKKRILVLVILVLLVALVAVGIAQAKNPLNCTTEYWFKGHLGITNDDGQTLIWEGTVSGDIEGTIQWWGVPEEMRFTGQASHYSDLSWEIWDGDVLLLAGEEGGSTTARHGKNSNWRTNGIVTEANGDFEHWIGRRTHASGHFTWAAPGLPEHGVGIFRIN